MVVYSGSNTDCKSSEPLETLVMLCYAMLCIYLKIGCGHDKFMRFKQLKEKFNQNKLSKIMSFITAS